MQALINANILTQDASQPAAEALAIENGVIIAVGTTEDILSIPAKEKKIINLHHKTILPGLCDSHIHLGTYSRGLNKIDLTDASRQECLERIRKAAETAPAGAWILGYGWDQNLWPEGYGDAAMLDEFTPNNPVYLTIKSLHAAWVNTSALKLANIQSTTPDPTGGTILRNSDGSPNGILLESAVYLVESIIPAPTIAQMTQLLQTGQETLWKLGITAIHDFDGALTFQGLLNLRESHTLQLRVNKNILVDQLPAAIDIGLRGGFGDEMLRTGAIKCFMDGAIGPHTAAMIQPYTGTQNLGELLYQEDELLRIYQQAIDHGFAVATHAIGDRANHALLNIIEKARIYEKEHGLPLARHRIEHAQILADEDIPRFHKMNIIASMQPIHLPMDIHTTDTTLSGRGQQSFLFNRLFSNGAIIIFGSDAPVASPNPFLGMHAAITRKKDLKEKGWHVEECIPLLRTLAAYTLAPAFAAGMEKKLGKLARGYLADLIVINQNFLAISPDELQHCLPLATMIGGNWVYYNIE